MIDWQSLPLAHQHAVLRQDFGLFAAAAFNTLYPETELEPAAYLDLMSARLQAVFEGEIQNLIVTVPPRSLKSFLTSIALPAFILGRDPTQQIMCVSYGQALGETLGRDRRKLMHSAFYRELFGTVLEGSGSPGRLQTSKNGFVIATSIDAAATGLGADYIIFDDPQKAQGAMSDAVRTATNNQLGQTFLSRRNDPKTARMLIVMQRLHEEDFVGHALTLPGMNWALLNLPAIAEEPEAHAFKKLGQPKLFTRQPGEALHPTRLPLAELDAIRSTIGEARFATQYLQRPAPAGGGLVQERWFERYGPKDLPDNFDEVIQSWDTANTTEEWSDWTVCTTWGRTEDAIYLLSVHRERMLFPDLVRATLRLAQRWRPDVVLIEDRASGTQLLQELRDRGIGYGRAIKPHANKEIRMTNQTALIESGRVWIPKEADWVQTYLRELLVFPNGKYDDQVDSTSQALAYLTAWLEARGLFEYMRREAQGGPSGKPARRADMYGLTSATGTSHVITQSGKVIGADSDGVFWLTEEDARPFRNQTGWTVVVKPEVRPEVPDADPYSRMLAIARGEAA